MSRSAEVIDVDVAQTFYELVGSIDEQAIVAGAVEGLTAGMAAVAEMPNAIAESRTQSETVELDPELIELRLLTEVDHLVDAMSPDGTVPEEVADDVTVNLEAAACEIAMPHAVSASIHKVETRINEEGSRHHTIVWLGKSAPENAMSGFRYHSHPSALARVEIEMDEAEYDQETIRPGVVRFFVSPKMPKFDAPAEVAKAEHLWAEDSLRASYAITNDAGEVIARRLESILVRDIPLEAWVAMFKDSANMFGRAFDIEDERSALSIMKLFKGLELPEDQATEGPVALVAAVLPYIADPRAKASVEKQLARFREGQERYRGQAKRTAAEWRAFDLELARSLKSEQATPTICKFIRDLQGQWNDETAAMLADHALGEGGFRMSRPLAAALEKAQQNILNSIAAVATDNEAVLDQMSADEADRLRTQIAFLEVLRSQDIERAELEQAEAQLRKNVAQQNLDVGGGCPGENGGNFRGSQEARDKSSATKTEEEGKKKAMKCPFCGAKVWGDPCAKVLKCDDCNAYAKNGKVVYRGDGGHKKRAERAAAREAKIAARREAELARQVDEAYQEGADAETSTLTQQAGQPTVPIKVGGTALALAA